MAPHLPNNPDLERFRRDARRLHRAVRAHDPAAAASGTPEEDPVDTFCRHACLTYSHLDHPDRWAIAIGVLSAHPDLPRRSIHAAAAAGDPSALAGHLRDDPASARREGGPFRWPPLLYLTYSRVEPVDAVAAAEVLLAAGADVDSGYLWQGLTPPFTALTGVFGEGEQGAGRQPRHRDEAALARLLLTRGADPNDGQALYNRMFRPDDTHLELLFDFGLGIEGGVWARRLGTSADTVPRMLQRQVEFAARQGFTERLELLARHGWGADRVPVDERAVPPIHRARTPEQVRAAVQAGADPNARVDGRTALHQAAFAGDVDLVQALLAAGADPTLRDAVHDATPLGWAEYACQPAVIELLRQRP